MIKRLPLTAALAALATFGGLSAAARAATALPPIKHVFIIVLENKNFDTTFGSNSPAQYLSQTLPNMGALVPNYYGIGHQSFPNYVAMISGQGTNPLAQADCVAYTNVVPGTVGSDGQAIGTGCVYPSAVQTIADQLSAARMTWKGYMEDMGNGPAGTAKTCRHPAIGSMDPTQVARSGDQYAARHNPFVYFHSIIDTPACTRDNVPLTQLPGDLKSAATTPNYSFIAPNLCNDGHDATCVDGQPGGLKSADVFLRTWVPRILASPGYDDGGLLIINFDETEGSSDSSACCNEPQFPNTPTNGGPYPGRGGGRVGTVMLSPYIDPGTIDQTAYNHFSMLRSVEDLFGLGHLGFAAQPGLQGFGSDLFTCYAPGRPHAHHGHLARGSEIKLAVVGQGAAARPLVELKLWHGGLVTLKVVRRGRHGRGRTVLRSRRLSQCAPLKVGLPFQHGRVIVTARAFGASERRTITF